MKPIGVPYRVGGDLHYDEVTCWFYLNDGKSEDFIPLLTKRDYLAWSKPEREAFLKRFREDTRSSAS